MILYIYLSCEDTQTLNFHTVVPDKQFTASQSVSQSTVCAYFSDKIPVYAKTGNQKSVIKQTCQYSHWIINSFFGRSLNNPFFLFLDCSRAAIEDSKKWGMLNLVNQLFKIYFKVSISARPQRGYPQKGVQF